MLKTALRVPFRLIRVWLARRQTTELAYIYSNIQRAVKSNQYLKRLADFISFNEIRAYSNFPCK